MAKSLRDTRGVTLIEIVVAAAIGVFLLVLSINALLMFWEQRTVDAEIENVLSFISRARVDTIASRSNQVYGVRLENSRMILFIGPTYDAATTTNVTVDIHPSIEIVNIALQGGGSNVLFKKWSGGTDQYGTFTLRFRQNIQASTTITVAGTGVAYIQ